MKKFVFPTDWQVAASKMVNDPTIIGESAVNSLKLNVLRKLSIPLPVDGKDSRLSNDFAKHFSISQKQSSVALVRANAELQQWDAIEELFIVKVDRTICWSIVVKIVFVLHFVSFPGLGRWKKIESEFTCRTPRRITKIWRFGLVYG